MATAWRIILILVAIFFTALYWAVAYIHLLMLGFCHGDRAFCEPGRAQREADMTDALIFYGLVYALIIAASWVLLWWRGKRE